MTDRTASLAKRLGAAVAAAVLAGAAIAASRFADGRVEGSARTISGTIEADDILVGSRLGGRVAEVLVREGDRVSAGQPLVRFEGAEIAARRGDAGAAVARARAALEKALAGSRPEEIAEARAQTATAAARVAAAENGSRPEEVQQAEAQLQAAEADLRVARATLDRLRGLAEAGVVARQELDEATAAFERAKGLRDAAAERVRLLKNGTRHEEVEQARSEHGQALARQRLVESGSRREDVEAARAELERALAGLEAVETDAAEMVVRAPADAFVEVLQVRPGDLLGPNAPVATLVEADRLWVRAFVPEPELGFVRPGQEVFVAVDSFPGERFPARVEFVANKGEFTPRNVQTREGRNHQVFAVRARLAGSDRLRPGMAAEVEL
jgi:multidrug resistance efflux pump